MTSLSASEWFTACASLVGWIGAATLATRVAHGEVGPAWAWPAFLLAAGSAVGTAILISEVRRGREDSRAREDSAASTLRRVG